MSRSEVLSWEEMKATWRANSELTANERPLIVTRPIRSR